MEGMVDPNFRGLERRLGQKPADVETWTIIRGQALLVGESGNLLMMRPPRNSGQDVWMARATDLRTAATRLARAAAARGFRALPHRHGRCGQCVQPLPPEFPRAGTDRAVRGPTARRRKVCAAVDNAAGPCLVLNSH